MDWRFALVLVLGLTILQLGTLVLVWLTPWPVWILALGVFVVLFWLADMRTVHLVVAEKKRGLRGYTG